MSRGISLSASLMALAAAAFGAPAYAQQGESSAQQAQAQQRYDIPAGDLATALRQFGEQADVNILFDPALVQGRSSAGLHGAYTQEQGIAALLRGSGLSASRRPGDGFAIAVGEAPTRLGAADGAVSSDDEEEIVVVGTHIRGLVNNTAPVTVLDRDYIDSTGISTTARLIETLPQNFALANPGGVLTSGVTGGGKAGGSSINLRGIGEGTTLVLVNGRRIASGFFGSAVDVSTLPLSAVDRVEVLTDGASALYGSDAIGGVVNFVLRSDYDGAETSIRRGWAQDGFDEWRVAHTMGTAWSSGNALASLEHYSRDMLRSDQRDFVPPSVAIGSLYPEDENYSLVLSGRQELSNTVSVFGDALFARRDTSNLGGQLALNEQNDSTDEQSSANLGLDWRLNESWSVTTTGTFARDELSQVQRSDGSPDFLVDTTYELHNVEVKADGDLFAISGGDVRAAIGASWREESLEFLSGAQTGSFEQTVQSLFGEVYVPLVGAGNRIPAISRLEFSLAGRYDDYTAFGSSFDPQIGVMWEPVSGLRLRASHGSSYKAPRLIDYDLSTNISAAYSFPDPDSPSGTSYQLQIFGAVDPSEFSPQEAVSTSFGIDYSPSGVENLHLAAGYYEIEYEGQIATPPDAFVVLGNPSSYQSLITRTPTIDQVNAAIAAGQQGQGFFPFDDFFNIIDPFDPSTVEVIVDLRRRNLSVTRTRGIDFSADYAFDVGANQVSLGLSGTYILDLEQQVTPAAQSFDTVSTYQHPVDLRARAYANWRQGSWASSVFVNYTDSYEDNRTAPSVSIDSYTTVDARVAYEFGNSRTPNSSGLTVALSAQNLFDQDPPTVQVLQPLSDLGYDPSNANPIGRLISIEVTKRW